VPTVDCTSVPDGTTADWVGVNGWNGVPGLFQDGTMSQCVNGQQYDYAWWTDAAESYSAPSLFAVAPGDVIRAEVWRETSGLWAYDVSDLTSGSSSSASESFSGPGTTAEWIAEDPGELTTEELHPFADFGSVTFTDLGLTVPSGSWTVPPYSDAVKMATDGWVEALPSPVQGSGTSTAFTVTYETPGELSSTAGSALMKHAQSTFVAPVPRIAPQRRAGQPGSRSIPAPKLGLARIKFNRSAARVVSRDRPAQFTVIDRPYVQPVEYSRGCRCPMGVRVADSRCRDPDLLPVDRLGGSQDGAEDARLDAESARAASIWTPGVTPGGGDSSPGWIDFRPSAS
jgi:hypothetical protein